MKKILIAFAAVGAAAGFSLAPAFAGELETQCEAYAAENGTDPSGCSCLAETADADATAELMAVQSQADIESLSEGALAAIQACWPDA